MTSKEAAVDSDLLQTEHFVLEEVLQLICERTQVLTQADAILVALTAGLGMICRATAGPLPIPLGIQLNAESAFLRNCLKSGRILRCDDSETDARVARDLSRLIGARSTVLVPLRGHHETLGVIQAFSLTPWFFTDEDVRCFDLFAELVLAALKPEDQNRRFYWLADVAGEVLQAAPPAPAFFAPATGSVAVQSASDRPASTEPKPVQLEPPKVEPAAAQSAVKPSALAETATVSGLEILTQPLFMPVTSDETPDLEVSERGEAGAEKDKATAPFARPEASVERVLLPSFLRNASLPLTSRPGLSVVMGLVAVAALFSVGVWWGMQVHSKATPTRNASAQKSVTSPAPPALDVLSPAISDNLLAPAQATSQEAPLIAVPASKLASLPKITGVRHWSSSVGSTVVIDMEDPVPYEIHRLMSPERIYFDLHDTALARNLDAKTMDVGDASLIRVRVAQPVTGVTRVVLDTKGGSNFSVSMESNPYRLVVELREPTKLAAANRRAPASSAAVSPSAVVLPSAAAKAAPTAVLTANASSQPLLAKTGKFRIVLDPGHGGWDLGTVGRQGLLEKDLVLDVSRRLGKLLQARLGAEVMFTRTGDEYLPLDQRADFANQAQADLFVSVHANYSRLATARGVETYYSDLFSAPGLREVENHGDGTSAHVTAASLSVGGLREKIDESRRLAASVQRTLFAALALKNPDIRDRGIKDAAFVVLTGTTMPAILTEISFVSSPADEQNLQSEAYRQQIAEALYKGIARYQESSPRAKVAQLRPAAGAR